MNKNKRDALIYIENIIKRVRDDGLDETKAARMILAHIGQMLLDLILLPNL